MKKLYYLEHVRLPREKSNSYQILQVCQSFIESGLEVELWAPSRKNIDPFVSQNFDLQTYYNLRQLPKISWLHGPDFLAAPLFRNWQRLSHYLNILTYSMVVTSRLRGISKGGLLFFRDPLFFGFISIFSLFFLRAKNLKSIIEIHSLSARPLIKSLQGKIINLADQVIALTHSMQRDLLTLGVDPRKITVEHDGVDVKSFACQQSKAEAKSLLKLDNPIVVTYVGKFHTNGEDKGITTIIESVPTVLDQYPSAHFYFVGGPLDWAQKYLDQASELNIPLNHLHFYDKRPVSEISLWLRSSDILLMPFPWTTHYAYYMSPLKLFEYMTSGTPIIASNLPSILEILTDGENALLCQPGVSQDLATKIILLLSNQEIAQNLASEARAVVENYDWQKRAKRIMNSTASLEL